MAEFGRWVEVEPLEEIKAKIFGGLESLHRIQRIFAKILKKTNTYILPQVVYVRRFSLEKTYQLLQTNTACRIGNPAKRESCDRISAQSIVDSPCHQLKIIYATEVLFFICSYSSLIMENKGFPKIEEGIGRLFLRHIADYTELLTTLLQQEEEKLFSIFARIKLDKEEDFFNLFASQFVYSSFLAWMDQEQKKGYRRLL